MNGSHYSHYTPEELILRDRLAIERTALANERTLLSYVRTMVGVIAIGATLLKLFDSWFFILSGWVLIAMGVAVLSIGFIRYARIDYILGQLNRDGELQATDWMHQFLAFLLRKLNLAKVQP